MRNTPSLQKTGLDTHVALASAQTAFSPFNLKRRRFALLAGEVAAARGFTFASAFILPDHIGFHFPLWAFCRSNLPHLQLQAFSIEI